MNESPASEPPDDTPSLVVRVLTADDAGAYRPLRLRALEELPPAFGGLPADEPDLPGIAARLPETADRCFFGAFDGTRLVGIARLSRYTASNEKHRAGLGGLYVLPAFRHRGGGKALVRAALDRAANTPGLRRIHLSVVTGQAAAIALYHSLGFRIDGTEPETFSKDGQFYDEHLMSLALASDNERRA